ncbi:hypothetical protein B0H67DRAFT_101941 [Lasiosphaeris hirsuta]|uniref:Protein kinase domain-containing protein n=1 Tax=Lasiosphaeris hirsuta TaxID=260670 RepID=A0AA40AYH3_9PEZI|nr:hypothetical protein B0H67DRAFT_101941 [Lasiosphaeris hirsuta]
MLATTLHLTMKINAKNRQHLQGRHPKGRHLGIFIPAEAPWQTFPISNYPQASNKWLKAHSNGFLVVDLAIARIWGINLFARSLDDNQLYSIKYYWPRYGALMDAPPKIRSDVRFARLEDHRVEVQLPNSPAFAKMHAYGFSDHDVEGRPRCSTVYSEPLKGSDLEGLATKFDEAEKAIPESFFWHVIDQVGHALAFLHTGLTREELEAGTTEPKRGWKPIAHGYVDLRNILLDFGDDPSDFDKCFPRVVLGGFGRAGRLTSLVKWWGRGAIDEGGRERRSITDDIYSLGAKLRELLEWREFQEMWERGGMDDWWNGVEDTEQEPEKPSHYSKRLIELVNGPESEPAGLMFYFDGKLDEHVYLHTLLPEARRMMAKYRAMDAKILVQASDVSWARPEKDLESIYHPGPGVYNTDGVRSLHSLMRDYIGPYEIVKVSYDEHGNPSAYSLDAKDAAELDHLSWPGWDRTALTDPRQLLGEKAEHARVFREVDYEVSRSLSSIAQAHNWDIWPHPVPDDDSQDESSDSSTKLVWKESDRRSLKKPRITHQHPWALNAAKAAVVSKQNGPAGSSTDELEDEFRKVSRRSRGFRAGREKCRRRFRKWLAVDEAKRKAK